MTAPGFSQLPFTTGTANSQTISFNAGAYDFSTTRLVTLSSNYQRVIPPGYPDANAGVAIASSPTALRRRSLPASVCSSTLPKPLRSLRLALALIRERRT